MSGAIEEPAGIWAALPIPALLVDGDDRVIDCNPAAEQFLSASVRSLRGVPLLERLAVDAPMEDALARVRRDAAPWFINDAAVGTGERPPVTCTLQIALMQVDSPAVLILISPREIVGRLGRAGAAQSAARSAIGMAEMLAHEIKNPLAGIAGAAQLLSMTLGPDDRELTDLIVEETRRVVKLLEQVEQFGNQRPPECRAVNIHDVLDRARRIAAVGFAANMRIVERYDPSLPSTWADADQLQQVFLNLLKNAAQAQPDGGEIVIRSFFEPALRLRGRDGPGRPLPLQIEIIDDGPGLPPGIAENVFEPFVSGRENGTGLGLALVSKIVSDHEGWIAVDSVPGRTVFRISLPVAPAEKEQG